MRTQRLINNVDYPQPEPEEQPEHHKLLCETAWRLREMADFLPHGSTSVVRILRQLNRIHRESDRAYKLVIDVLSEQKSLEKSLADLAAEHKNAQGYSCSRQSWLQHMQSDVDIIKRYWPDVGEALDAIMRRRGQQEGPGGVRF